MYLFFFTSDYDVVKNCLPEYKFKRFDMPFGSTATASGFNFRFILNKLNYITSKYINLKNY
jgi:hypothetical protein